jgi:3-hydroxyacyl-[acyl-carrier-protein] dehydratase
MSDTELETENQGEWLNPLDVLSVLPHRYPFLFVDRLRVIEPGRRAMGLKRVTGSEWFGESELPNGEMPGLLVVEALAQTSAAVLIGLLDGSDGAIGYFASADRVKFRTLPRAGDTLVMAVELVWYRRGVARLCGIATVNGRLSTRGNFTTVVRGRTA